jgi:hypothetical protein
MHGSDDNTSQVPKYLEGSFHLSRRRGKDNIMGYNSV